MDKLTGRAGIDRATRDLHIITARAQTIPDSSVSVTSASNVLVLSSSTPGVTYTVDALAPSCNCAAFTLHTYSIHMCKHIMKARLLLKLTTDVGMYMFHANLSMPIGVVLYMQITFIIDYHIIHYMNLIICVFQEVHMAHFILRS